MDATKTAATATFRDDTFNTEVLGSSTPVLVDFWAAWCGPCRMMEPTIEAVARELDGQVTVGKLNVDEHPETAQRYGVRSIPTLLLFKDGEVVGSSVGLTSQADLTALARTHVV